MKVIHHVVDIEATKAKVWWALTEPDGMAGWWGYYLESLRLLCSTGAGKPLAAGG